MLSMEMPALVDVLRPFSVAGFAWAEVVIMSPTPNHWSKMPRCKSTCESSANGFVL